jgi:hypothetical protein
MSRVRTVAATVRRSTGGGLTDRRGPTDEIVGEHRALQPSAVGLEVPRRHVGEAGALFQAAYVELDHGVGAVEASRATASPVRSVRNAKCRQSGQMRSWRRSVSRVRRTMRRTPL